MTADDDPIGEIDLLAYVDDHLDPARRRLVERHLVRHPDAARRVADDMVIRDGIRRLFDGNGHEPIPEHLHERLRRRLRPRLVPPLARAAAAVALVAGGGIGGWWAAGDAADSRMAGVERFAEGPLHAVSQTGPAPPQPAEWLGAGLRRTVRAPDLSPAGLSLIAQDPIGGTDSPAVQLTYESRDGLRVYLFLEPRRDDQSPRLRHSAAAGRGVVYWAEGPLLFVITGETGADELRSLAELAISAPPVASAPNQPPPREGLVPVAGGG